MSAPSVADVYPATASNPSQIVWTRRESACVSDAAPSTTTALCTGRHPIAGVRWRSLPSVNPTRLACPRPLTIDADDSGDGD